MDSRASTFINSLSIISNKIYQENLSFNKDIQNRIDYLNKKKRYSEDDILKLEIETINEWFKALELLIQSRINFIESKKNLKIFLKKELKLLYKKEEELKDKKDYWKIDDFENFYHSDVEGFIDEVDVLIKREKRDNWRFWLGLFVGTFLGAILSLSLPYLLNYIGSLF